MFTMSTAAVWPNSLGSNWIFDCVNSISPMPWVALSCANRRFVLQDVGYTVQRSPSSFFVHKTFCIRILLLFSVQAGVTNLLKLKVKCELFGLSGINDALVATKRPRLLWLCRSSWALMGSCSLYGATFADSYTRFDFAPNLCHLFFMKRSRFLPVDTKRVCCASLELDEQFLDEECSAVHHEPSHRGTVPQTPFAGFSIL